MRAAVHPIEAVQKLIGASRAGLIRRRFDAKRFATMGYPKRFAAPSSHARALTIETLGFAIDQRVRAQVAVIEEGCGVHDVASVPAAVLPITSDELRVVCRATARICHRRSAVIVSMSSLSWNNGDVQRLHRAFHRGTSAAPASIITPIRATAA